MTDPKTADPKSEPKSSVMIIENTLRRGEMQDVIKKSLGEGVSLDKFTQAAITAIKHKPEIFEDCDRASIYNALVEAARDGLIPDGKQGALVPFRAKSGNNWIKRCQWLLMPAGILDKLAKLGVTAYAVSVYANDDISIWFDDEGQHVKHEPVIFGDRGERVGAYACGRTKQGVTYVEAMNMEDIDRVMAVSKQKNDKGEMYGPWVEWPERMAEKSCLHRLCKRMPNVEIADDPEFREADPGPGITVLPRESVPTIQTGRPKALQAVVDATPQTPVEPEPPDQPASEIF